MSLQAVAKGLPLSAERPARPALDTLRPIDHEQLEARVNTLAQELRERADGAFQLDPAELVRLVRPFLGMN